MTFTENKTVGPIDLLTDIRSLIEISKNRIARLVNSEMTILYWHIGARIKSDILKFERAEYGGEVLKTLSKSLRDEYGASFNQRNLWHMIQFYELFPEQEIVKTVSSQLSWSHFIELMKVSDHQAREFYTYMSIQSHWSVRQLHGNIHRMLFERTEISRTSIDNVKKDMAILVEGHQLTTNLVLKDPYILEFLNLPQEHYESDLEAAILQEIEKFMLELGTGFSFVARQKRITIDNEHFYIDLLMYNIKIKRFVVIELKSGRFKPEYKGQMELYLGWLRRYECLEGEEPPIGIILCTEKSKHQIELLDLSSSGIHVAEYWTELPPKEVFEKKIQQIVTHVKENAHVLKNKNK